MLWPIVLPFKMTFWALAAIVILLTTAAPALKWRRAKTFWLSLLYAVVAFVPSCTGIMLVVDEFRFGTFEYATIQDIDDFRARRNLPPAAKDIVMHKQAIGYRARYSISASELQDYLDRLWEQYGEASVSKRDERFDRDPVIYQEIQAHLFSDLGWEPLENPAVFYSPTEADGGGATYYFDSNAGVVLQRTGYW